MEKTKWLLDTDIGNDNDDCMALAYLLHQSEIDLLGITTVTGESVRRAMLADAMCRLAGKRIPIYPGCETPILGPLLQSRVNPEEAAQTARFLHAEQFPRCRALRISAGEYRGLSPRNRAGGHRPADKHRVTVRRLSPSSRAAEGVGGHGRALFPYGGFRYKKMGPRGMEHQGRSLRRVHRFFRPGSRALCDGRRNILPFPNSGPSRGPGGCARPLPSAHRPRYPALGIRLVSRSAGAMGLYQPGKGCLGAGKYSGIAGGCTGCRSFFAQRDRPLPRADSRRRSALFPQLRPEPGLFLAVKI